MLGAASLVNLTIAVLAVMATAQLGLESGLSPNLMDAVFEVPERGVKHFPSLHQISELMLTCAWVQQAVQILTMAFIVVVASVGLMMPIMLYVFNLQASGWTWQYVGLFVSMLASTDAVAIISTMKTSVPLACTILTL